MLKFDYLVKNIEIFIGQFIMPFCFDRPNVLLEIVKINSELLKIKERDGEIEISNKNASVFSVALPAYCGIIKKSKT